MPAAPLMVIGCAMVFALISPLRSMWIARGQLSDLRQEEGNLDRRIAALSEERDRLLTDAEVERRARAELGMVRPGEIAVIVPREAEPVRRQAVATSRTEARPRGEPFFSRWWRAAMRIARVRV